MREPSYKAILRADGKIGAMLPATRFDHEVEIRGGMDALNKSLTYNPVVAIVRIRLKPEPMPAATD